ncbi:MAG TPA: DUF2383 domain-containing protein [Thermoanaerobaculia bacterium]|nr:DUF2383 domain-containing protein [Thermoanaerobaculia bacterium]
MPTTTANVETLNGLLRGEMSALETYRQAIEKLDNNNAPGATQLHDLQRDHREAADALWRHISHHGEKPSESSGAWGAFAKAVTGTAKLFGNTAALKALKEGEEHGVKDYEAALKDEQLPEECKNLIRNQLLPKQRAHVTVIDRLMDQQ